MSDPIPTANRQIVTARALGHCERCGAWGAGELHHRRPKGNGGSSRPDRHNVENLAYLCTSCHKWTHSFPKKSAPVGFLVERRSGLNPVDVPIHMPAGPVWLTPHGTYSQNAPEMEDA
jgi:hypothetical protein